MRSLADIILAPNNTRSGRIDLTISSNSIGVEGCSALATLCSNPDHGSMLSHLYLSQCSLGDEGITLLSSAALSNSCTGLTLLDLLENSITKKGRQSVGIIVSGVVA